MGPIDQQSGNTPETQTPPIHDNAFIEFLIVLAKHKRLLYLFPLVAALLAAIISFLISPTFSAVGRILPPQPSSVSAAAILGQLGSISTNLGLPLPGLKNPSDLYVGLLRSRTVMDRLIERFDLEKVYDEDTKHDTRKRLEKRTVISVGRDGIIAITFDDRDPARAAAVTNGYMEELDKLTQSLAVTEASQRRVFFEKQLKAARDALATAEMELRKTQEKTGLIKLDDQGKAIIDSVARLRGVIALKEVEVSALRSFATSQNPDVLRAQDELAALKTQLTKLEKAKVAGHGNIFIPTGKVPEAGLEYVRRLREVKYHEAVFELLSKQYELARVEESKDSGVVQIVDHAVTPEKRSKPERGLIVAIATVLGLMLGIVTALLREALIKARSDERTASRLDVLKSMLHQSPRPNP